MFGKICGCCELLYKFYNTLKIMSYYTKFGTTLGDSITTTINGSVDLSGYLKKSGNTMTGNLLVSNQRVLGLETTYPPVNAVNTQAVSYAQLKSVDDNKLDKSGGTITGNSDMSSNKIINLEIAYLSPNLNQTQAVSYSQLKSVDDKKNLINLAEQLLVILKCQIMQNLLDYQ